MARCPECDKVLRAEDACGHDCEEPMPVTRRYYKVTCVWSDGGRVVNDRPMLPSDISEYLAFVVRNLDESTSVDIRVEPTHMKGA